MMKIRQNIPFVIFAEDDNEDWLLISDVLDEECSTKLKYERVVDGEALLDRLRDGSKILPHLIMMDLKMPKMDGAEALKAIRADPSLRHIPVIILTTSSLEADIFKAFHGGANSYLVKPVKFPDMASVLKEVHHYWTSVSVLPDPIQARTQS
ncbi:MAG: response regulator [bacterium]